MILTFGQLKYTTDNIIISSDVALDPTIDIGNVALQQYDDTGAYVTVDVTSVTVSGNICTLVTPTLADGKLYSLTLFSIRDVTLTELIPAQVFRFLSISPVNLLNVNNVYTKLSDIDKLLTTENLLKHKDDYTIQFKPSTYNFETKQYEYSNELITVNNNKIMLDLLIKEYFTEYKVFYDAINNNINTTLYDEDYINDLHLTFMNNIAKWYSLKGNVSFIEIMLNLYAKYIGYNVLSVVEDPEHNFIYRISSSIPTTEWNSYIKPLVHPMSWNAIYNEVTSHINGFYIQPLHRGMTDSLTKNYYDRKLQMVKQTWALDCMSYLDAEAYSHQYSPHYNRIKKLMHKAGNVEYENVFKHETATDSACNLKSVNDHFKFGMNLNVHTTGTEYQKVIKTPSISGLYKELKDKKNIKYHLDRFNHTITLDFGMTGVANEYIFKQYRYNKLINTYESLLSRLTVPIERSDRFVLEIKKDGTFQDINVVDQKAFEIQKTIPLSYDLACNRTKYIGIRNTSNKTFMYNNLAVINFTSEHNSNVICYTNDLNYTYAISGSAVSGAFITEFDTPSSSALFNITSTNFTFGSTPYKTVKFKYNKAGFSKFLWQIYTNGILVEEKLSYFNNVTVNVASSDYSNTRAKLTVYYKNGGSYTLNNMAICV